jgi:hypothetical protein
MQGDFDLAHVHPTSVTPASPQSQVAQVGLAEPMDEPPHCPICRRNFKRLQERNRHLRTFLPHSFFCPRPHCPWRGDRRCNLNKHWQTTHANFGEAPNPEDCKIYDPDPLVQSVVSGESPIELAITIALQEVQSRAQILDKVGVWKDGWGRIPRTQH